MDIAYVTLGIKVLNMAIGKLKIRESLLRA